jgi:hypothetical protein
LKGEGVIDVGLDAIGEEKKMMIDRKNDTEEFVYEYYSNFYKNKM